MLGSKMAGPKTQQLLFSNIIRQSIQTSWCFSGFQTTQEKSGCNPKATRLVWQDGFTLEPFVWLGTIFSKHLFQAAGGHQSLQKDNCRILWWPPCSECIL